MVRNSKHQVTTPVTTPEKYLGLCVHSWGAPIHPAQYPMKNIAFTMARLVFPFTLDCNPFVSLLLYLNFWFVSRSGCYLRTWWVFR